jgi:hypothetical protein
MSIGEKKGRSEHEIIAAPAAYTEEQSNRWHMRLACAGAGKAGGYPNRCVLLTIYIPAHHWWCLERTLQNCGGFCYILPMEYMDKCRHHPDRDACVLCQKMEVAYCQECLDACRACTDPCLYCKFRQSCVIWELCRKEARKRCKELEGEKAKGEKGEAG